MRAIVTDGSAGRTALASCLHRFPGPIDWALFHAINRVAATRVTGSRIPSP
jgi:hypothetical protein